MNFITISNWSYFIYGLFLLLFMVVILYILIRREINNSFIRFAPNIFTALGILGTFGSLAIAFTGLDINNSKSIEALPSILGIAFITSIIGIILSHSFSLWISTIKKEQSEKEEYTKIVPEKILYDLMKNSERQNNLIIAHLTRSADSIESLDEKFSSSLTQIVENFTNSMMEMQQNIQNAFEKTNNKMHTQVDNSLKTFGQISKQSSDHFKQLNEDNISTISSSFNEFSQYAKSYVESIQGEITKQSKEHFENQKEIFKSQNQQIDTFKNELFDQSKETADNLNSTLENIAENISKNTEETLSQINKDFERITNNVEQWIKLTENSIHKTTGEFRNSVNEYDDQKETQKILLERFKEQLNLLNNLHEKYMADNERFEYYERRTDELAEKVLELNEEIVSAKEY